MSATPHPACISAATSTLVLVDYQARLMPAIHEHTRVLAEAQKLADAAALLDVPVIGTEQNPGGLGPNVQTLRQRCASTLPKMHFDACEDGLLEVLPDAGARPDVVLAGCEAHVCVLQTALGLLRAGRRLWLVASASGSRRASDQALAMQRLQAAGAVLVSSDMVIFEWLRSCRHPRFKDALPLLRPL
jgi:nicotinamidase-related amidase